MERVPFMQNIRCESPQSARDVPQGQLEMTGCEMCGFVWNAAFDPKLLRYDEHYENDQSMSGAFTVHLLERIDAVSEVLSEVHDPVMVEVGCGQGGFLNELAKRKHGNYFGFDPAWRGEPNEKGVLLSSDYYDAASAGRLPRTPDVLLSRHTIEHIADPLSFLKTLRAATLECPGRTFIETPCVDWIIANGQVQDFFYEHCSLFTQRSLALAIKEAGLGTTSVKHVFGNQYLWAGTGKCAGDYHAHEIPDFVGWGARQSAYMARWVNTLMGARRIYLWGAGSKGVIFTLLLQSVNIDIAGVIDINLRKQKTWTPLTAKPVLAPSEANLDGSAVVIMNPMYADEIRRSLAHMKAQPEVFVLE
jgi:hypothetical protein